MRTSNYDEHKIHDIIVNMPHVGVDEMIEFLTAVHDDIEEMKGVINALSESIEGIKVRMQSIEIGYRLMSKKK